METTTPNDTQLEADRWRDVAIEPLPEVGTKIRIWRKTLWAGQYEMRGWVTADGVTACQPGQHVIGNDFTHWRPQATGPAAFTTKD